MPSVETQTAWSWIQDMLLVARYKDIGEERYHLLSDAQGKKGETSPEEPPSNGTEGFLKDPRGFVDEAKTPLENATSSQEVHLPIIETAVTPAEEVAQYTSLENLRFSSDSSEDEELLSAGRLPEVNTRSIPLPAVLQYLRESEALASRYFSLSAKHKRKGHQRNPTHPMAIEKKAQTESVDTRPATIKGETVVVACDFCGKKIPRLSLLGSLEESCAEITSFCCDDYKEFSILVAAATRQMLKGGLHSKARSIKVSSDKKSAKLQKTAEERALAMMIRRRKWEERKEQKLNFLQSTSFHSLTKHTKTIEFSLLSPKILDAGWMVSPRPQDEATQASNRAQKKGHSPKPSLSSDVDIDHPTKHPTISPNLPTSPPPVAKGPLRVQHYADGRPFTTILPDMTGQCYYTSGRIAILIYTLSHGTLGYLVFEDDDGHTLLAMLDEGGRITCYGANRTLKMVLTHHHGVMFDDNQCVKRKWSWVGGASTTLFQPISLQLNKAVVLRCSQKDNIVLKFSAANSYTKFFIGREQKTLLKMKDQEDLGNGGSMEAHLQDAQARISELLGKLQYTQRLQRLHGARQCC